MTGISAAGIAAFSQPVLAQESNANVSVRFTDQESDGESIVIDSLATDVEAELLIFESEGDRSLYKRMNLDAGTEFNNRQIELDNPIPETQLISISVQPPEGGGSYGGARATVTVIKPAYGTTPGVQMVEENSEAGFHSPYFLYTPGTPDSAAESVNNSRQRPLLVEVYPWGDFQERVEGARGRIQGGVMRSVADATNCPVLVAPLWFRAAGPRFGLESGTEPADSRRERVDLQLLAMIEDAKSRLSGGEYTVADQIHFSGGSSAGVFIDLFAALHPEHIRVFSSGANGLTFLPLAELTDDIPTYGDREQMTVPWPIGVADFEELAGKKFNKEAWMEIDQFRWISENDQDSENPDGYVHKLHRGSDELDQLVEEIFGSLQVDHRFATSQRIYEHLGVPAKFTVFEGTGHVPESKHFRKIIQHQARKVVEDFEVIHLVPQKSASEIRVGESVTVTVTAENPTPLASATTVRLAVDGTEVDSTEIEVDPNSAETVELEATFDDTGEFTLSVNGTAVGDPIVVTEQRTETSTVTDSEFSSDETASRVTMTSERKETTATEGPGFSVVQGVAALAGLGYLLNRWR